MIQYKRNHLVSGVAYYTVLGIFRLEKVSRTLGTIGSNYACHRTKCMLLFWKSYSNVLHWTPPKQSRSNNTNLTVFHNRVSYVPGKIPVCLLISIISAFISVGVTLNCTPVTSFETVSARMGACRLSICIVYSECQTTAYPSAITSTIPP